MKIKTINFFPLMLGILISFNLAGQNNFSLQFAQSFPTLKFSDSEGNRDEDIKNNIGYSYGVNYSYFFKSGFFLRPELGYKNMGAMSVLNNKKIDWQLNYTEMNFSPGFMVNQYRFKPYVGANFYFSLLFKGYQTIGDEYYDLLENKNIKNTDFGAGGFMGISYPFSYHASIFFETRNNFGIQQLESNENDNQNQRLYNQSLSFHFGLSFSITELTSSDKSEDDHNKKEEE